MDLLSSFPMAAPDGGAWWMCFWLDGSLYPDGAVGLPRIVDPSVALANSYVSYLAAHMSASLKGVANDAVERRKMTRLVLLEFKNSSGEGIILHVEHQGAGGAGDACLKAKGSDGLTRLAGALGALDFEAFVARHGNSPVGLSRNQIIGDRGATGTVASATVPVATCGEFGPIMTGAA